MPRKKTNPSRAAPKPAAPKPCLYFEIYRSSSIGETLIDSLDSFIEESRISKEQANRMLRVFDKVMTETLSSVRGGLKFKGRCDTYNFNEDVWKFVVRDVTFTFPYCVKTVWADKVKIVACKGVSV